MQVVRTEMPLHGKRTSTRDSEENNYLLLCNYLEIWPVTLSQLVRHAHATASDKEALIKINISDMGCRIQGHT